MVQKPEHWPVFIISLIDANSRRASILRQCERYGIQPTIIDAIDGRHSLPIDLEQMVDRHAALNRTGRNLTDSEFACALSHHFIYRRIIGRSLPGAIILEDDAILTDSFYRFINEQVYLKSDMVQMDHQHASVYRWRGKIEVSGITLLPLAANAGLTTGYSVSAAAAKYILENSEPIKGFADWPCDITPLSPFVTKPPIIQHPDFCPKSSYIEQSRAQQVGAAAGSNKVSSRWKRFFNKNYWQRWWFKRITVRIS